MMMLQKLLACAGAALLMVGLSGCCSSGCGLGGGCGLSNRPAPQAVSGGCSTCDQSYAQTTYAQPTHSQGYSTPAYSSGGAVSAGSGTVSAPTVSAPSFGSGTSSPAFSGGSGSR